MVEPEEHAAPAGLPRRKSRWSPARRDRAFAWTVGLAGGVAVLLFLLVGGGLGVHSKLAMRAFGVEFLWQSDWDPLHQHFGALPFLWGTLYSSVLALLLALPVSLGAAIFLSEIAPRWLAAPVSFAIELLAAIPSIVYGVWGLFVLVPLLRPVQMWLWDHCGSFPLFTGTPYGLGMMAAAVVLAIMVTPILTSLSREVLRAVPDSVRMAAYAVGATRWETIRGPVLEFGRAGILAAILLAFGRALGETMAVAMVIGNRPSVSVSLFEPSYTMASLLANEFAEAISDLTISTLMSIACLLFVVTILVNALARYLLWRVTSAGLLVRE